MPTLSKKKKKVKPHQCVLAVGVDLEEIARFRRFRAKSTFIQKIFTPLEQKYCFSKKDPAPHLAARFCVKEAVRKALMSNGNKDIANNVIETQNNARGVPEVKILDMSARNVLIHASITHSKNTAAAFVVMQSIS